MGGTTSFNFGTHEKPSNRLIGHFFLEGIEWKVPKCELGYFIDGTEEGSGTFPKACAL